MPNLAAGVDLEKVEEGPQAVEVECLQRERRRGSAGRHGQLHAGGGEVSEEGKCGGEEGVWGRQSVAEGWRDCGGHGGEWWGWVRVYPVGPEGVVQVEDYEFWQGVFVC